MSTTTISGTLAVGAIVLDGEDLQTTLDSITDSSGGSDSDKMNTTNPTFTGTLNGFNFNSMVWPSIPTISSGGVMEVGRYMDWHYVSSDTIDYPMRMTLNSDYTLSMSKGLTISSGTLTTPAITLNGTSLSTTLTGLQSSIDVLTSSLATIQTSLDSLSERVEQLENTQSQFTALVSIDDTAL